MDVLLVRRWKDTVLVSCMTFSYMGQRDDLILCLPCVIKQTLLEEIMAVVFLAFVAHSHGKCLSANLFAYRKRSPQLGSASSPSSSGLSLQPTSGFGLPASGTPSPYLTSVSNSTF